MRSPSPRTLTALRLVAPLVMVALFAAAAGVLYRTFRDNPWDRLGTDLVAIGPVAALAALAATVASYTAMTGYDALALRYVEHPLPYRRFALASFVATAFGNNLGASAVVGAALRARVYSAWRVPGFAITRIIGFNLVTLALGAAVLAGGGMLHHPVRAAQALHLPVAVAVSIGAVLLLAVVGYVAWARTGGNPLGWGDWRIDRPSRRLALAQVALSTFEWLTMAAALYVLLPPQHRLPFLPFAAAFAIATAAGLMSNVPGGLGVFETVLVVLLDGGVPPAQLAVALVAYRLCYFLLPLLLAAVLLVLHEVRHGAASAVAGRTPSARAFTPATLTPSVLALGVAGVGMVLLVRGDLPGDTRAPDVSTFTMSLAGVVALLLARGLHRRLHGAWLSTVALMLGVACVGATHEEAVLTGAAVVMVLLLVPARGAFYRTSSLLADPRRWAWPVSVAGLVAAAFWWQDLSSLTGSGDSTWWAASLSGDTPGPARLLTALGVAGVFIGGGRMLAPCRRGPKVSDDGQLALADTIVSGADRCSAHLAFTGDKRLFFSELGGAFLMYQIEGRSWVVMGDPIGDPTEFRDLMWSFVEQADRNGGRPVFYSVRGELGDLYRECGLTLVKLGEEAVLHLDGFGLEGKSRAGLRHRRNKMVKAGVTMEIVPAGELGPVLEELREVSDAWLTQRNGKEKRFSLGAFDDEYVNRFPVAVVRHEGRVVAFGTLWLSGDLSEVQVDLMRRLPDGPRDVMTYLFVECILWAKEQGYARFHLGMAPLSGLNTDSTAPFWEKIGHLLWKHGEQFYNFKGLRMFKDGFDPDWQTRYVAARGGPALPTSMVNVATLVGGGVRGIIAR